MNKVSGWKVLLWVAVILVFPPSILFLIVKFLLEYCKPKTKSEDDTHVCEISWEDDTDGGKISQELAGAILLELTLNEQQRFDDMYLYHARNGDYSGEGVMMLLDRTNEFCTTIIKSIGLCIRPNNYLHMSDDMVSADKVIKELLNTVQYKRRDAWLHSKRRKLKG